MPPRNTTTSPTGEEEVKPVREELDVPSFEPLAEAVATPRRRGRPPGSKNRTSRASTASLEAQIGGLLVFVNMPLQLVPALQRDALDPMEITALAKAIDAECKTNARFRKYVEMALKTQGATNLAGVLIIILGRRAIRHDILPVPEELGKDAVDMMLGQTLNMLSAGKMDPNAYVPQQAATSTEGT